MKKLNPKQQIALDGELLVARHLPGRCGILNKHGETYLPFDIFWHGIKIDVKSTSNLHFKGCYFTLLKKWSGADDTILVFVHINKPHYFWVTHSAEEQKSFKHISYAISGYDLAQEIETVYAKHSLLHKETVDNMLKQEYSKN